MRFIKLFSILFVSLFIGWLILSHVSELILGLICAVVLALMASVLCDVFFGLMRTEKWYYQIVAILMTGVIGAVALLGFQYAYHRAGLRFMD